MELRPRKLRLQLWGMGRPPPSLIPFSTNECCTITGKRSWRSLAMDASALYENHFNLPQMGLLTDNLMQRAL